jgi:hypothetical protein
MMCDKFLEALKLIRQVKNVKRVLFSLLTFGPAVGILLAI